MSDSLQVWSYWNFDLISKRKKANRRTYWRTVQRTYYMPHIYAGERKQYSVNFWLQLTNPPNTIGAIGFLLLFFFGPVHSDPEFSRSGIEQFELKMVLKIQSVSIKIGNLHGNSKIGRSTVQFGRKWCIYLSETVLFLREKSNFCLNFSKLSVEKFFLKVIFLNSIRIGTTS